MGRRRRKIQATPFTGYVARGNMRKNPPIGVQVFYRARNKRSGLAWVVAHVEENKVLAYNGKLWALSRPHKGAPWKGFETHVAWHYCTPEHVQTQGERYKGCLAGDPANLMISQALVDAGLVPPLVVTPPPNESLLTLGARRAAFGQSYWNGIFPYDSREHIALLLVEKGTAGAKRYLRADARRMIEYRNEKEVYERACAMLEAEVINE